MSTRSATQAKSLSISSFEPEEGGAVVIELGRGKSGQIGLVGAQQMATDVFNTEGHDIGRLIFIEGGKIILDKIR